MTQFNSTSPLKVAIVGAGPSGFYAADALFKSKLPVQVDLFDKLATPYGLLRGGVAPDHQKMKSVGKYYERVATTNDNFRFFGNVTIGKDISTTELKEFYHAVIYSYGAETDRKLNIPGENLDGSHTATSFVGWYNGHPDYQHLDFNLNVDDVVIIGLGNVAIDVCRILAKNDNELATSDITKTAQEKLSKSTIKRIHLVGRRGPVQSAFTQHEIQELGELTDCSIYVNPADLELSEQDQIELENSIKAKKNVPILESFKTQSHTKKKQIILHYFKSPTALNGTNTVESITLEKNVLEGDAGKQKTKATGETETLPCSLVFRSIGYKGLPLGDLPFDDKSGTIPNEAGRIVTDNQPVLGLYTSGWIKRGATGVLGTNKPDSSETVKSLIEDIEQLQNVNVKSNDALFTLLESRSCHVVTFQDWLKVNEEEIKRATGEKPREKFVSTEDILSFLETIKEAQHGIS